ncbi:MAG: hypothetical protein AUJ85_08065 [Elusimicrobia bacterium CG1_02_37_114]|nr:MAG: hypothetical protein AUJ85_08065 [Elusimicrobia bacterium CG1_02_37_114]PIV52843.1 MAG: hypothetical protein COS17_07015 [Elusimicrobia bacterium CG02_land_8_20_14_3_00_37_13]PIZ13449.1 MAG: hypothetical protein COY53_04740 [Elusimicrobia bacterium CG_4_10_14_0_8_um_filter_37_32]
MSLRLNSSEIFKALSVESRIRIIELLKSKGSLGVKNIAEVIGITPAAVSQHLKVLKHAGLVRSTRKGYWIPYSIDEEAMENCRIVVDDICRCGCKSSCRFENEKQLSLSSLEKYKKELEKEMKDVKKRISEIKK